MSAYSKSSPWSNTKINIGNYLDFYVKRSIPPQADDILYLFIKNDIFISIFIKYTNRNVEFTIHNYTNW